MTGRGWTQIANYDYIEGVVQKSKTIWLANFIPPSLLIPVQNKSYLLLLRIFFINGIKTRQCLLQTCRSWNKFVETCYSLGCENCGLDGWASIQGGKQKFDKWLVTENVREKANYQNQDSTKKCAFFKYDDSKFKQDNLILTAYDTGKRKRMIIDGLHRAASLTMACEEGKSISSVRILECFGKNINIIFPLDVHHLPGRA